MSVTRVESIPWPSTHKDVTLKTKHIVDRVAKQSSVASPISGLVEALSARLGGPSRPRASAVRAKH
jgi:hypothetical protein